LGKSLIALDLCARLSTGRPFPDGRSGPGPASALVLSAEDSPADTIVPRLERLGADMQRVSIWQREAEDEDWPWRFPAQADRLDDALARTDARLAVIDPLMAFLDDSVQSASDPSVRRALGPLMHLADKHRCTLLMHRHLNKQGGAKALYRGLGSIAFVAACRFAMMVARDPEAPARCVLAQVRNSLAGTQPSLGYRLTDTDGALPTVEWLGDSPLSADDLLAGAAHASDRPRDQAALFLKQFLADGPRTSDDVGGIAPRTLERAKKDLGVRCGRVRRGGRPVTYWLLPSQKLPSGIPPEFERWFAELDKQFPPPALDLPLSPVVGGEGFDLPSPL
jgi:hypothetical protein